MAIMVGSMATGCREAWLEDFFLKFSLRGFGLWLLDPVCLAGHHGNRWLQGRAAAHLQQTGSRESKGRKGLRKL